MQSYHGTPRNQNKLKIPLTLMLFYRPTSWCEKCKVYMVSKIKFCWYLTTSINESHHDALCSEFPKRTNQPGAKQNYRSNFSHRKIENHRNSLRNICKFYIRKHKSRITMSHRTHALCKNPFKTPASKQNISFALTNTCTTHRQ